MDILGLTTTEAVRAILGISDETGELDDAVFTSWEIEVELEVALGRWLPESYLNIVQAGVASNISLLSLCAKYQTALLLLPSLQIAVATRQSDGQNEFQRQAFDWEALRRNLEAALARYREALLESLTPTKTVATPTWIGRAAPSFDPVTGQ